MEGFNQNNVWRLRLARYFQKALGCAELSPIYLESVKLQSLFKEFEEGVTRICVMGFHGVGKTSFINALLGLNELPIDVLPCTNHVEHIVKYGQNRKALLHFQSPFPMDYRETLPNDIIDYLKWHNYGRSTYGNDIQIPTLEYSFSDSLCFIQNPEPPDSVLFPDSNGYGGYLYEYFQSQSAFYCIDFYFPSDLLKKRIIISDTHGLTDAPLMNIKTIELAQKADIILYLSHAFHPFTQSERYSIEYIVNHCREKLSGFIVNKIDLVSHFSVKYQNYYLNHAQEYVSDNAVFFTSSKNALEACNETNDELLQQSGIPKVKAFIEQLAVRKERERFIVSSNQLKDVIRNDMLSSIDSEITKTFGENRSEKMGNLIFISAELKSIINGLKELITEIENQADNETK